MNRFLNVSGQNLLFGYPTRQGPWKEEKVDPCQNRWPLHTSLSLQWSPAFLFIKHIIIQVSGRMKVPAPSLNSKLAVRKKDSSFGRKIWKPKPRYGDSWSLKGKLSIEDSLFFFFFLSLKKLFLAMLGLSCCARTFSSCGEWGLFFIVAFGLLIVVASLGWALGWVGFSIYSSWAQ